MSTRLESIGEGKTNWYSLKGHYFWLYHNSDFKKDNNQLLLKATYLAGRSVSYQKRREGLIGYLSEETGKGTHLSENDRKYLIELFNISNKGLEQRARRVKSDFLKMGRDGVEFQRYLAGDSSSLESMITPPDFSGIYTEKLTQKPKSSFFKKALIFGLGAIAGAYLAVSALSPYQNQKFETINQGSPQRFALQFSNLSNYSNLQEKYLSESNELAEVLTQNSNLNNDLSSYSNAVELISSEEKSLIEQNSNLIKELNSLKIKANQEKVPTGNTNVSLSISTYNADAVRTSKTNLLQKIGSDVDQYRKYALTQGSRSSLTSLKMSEESAENAGYDFFSAATLSYGTERFTGLRKDDLSIMKPGRKFLRSFGNELKRLTGPVFDRKAYKGLNPMTGTVNYFGRNIIGLVDFAGNGANTLTFGLGNNVTVPALWSGNDFLESGKHLGQSALNVTRLPFEVTRGNFRKDSNKVLDWFTLVPPEYVSNVAEIEGYSNAEHMRRSVREKGNTGVVLEFLGDGALLGYGIDNALGGDETRVNGGVSGGETGGPGVQ